MLTTDEDRELKDAYNSGKEAFRAGHKRDENPFTITMGFDLRREEWCRGWDDEKWLQENTSHKQS